MKKLSRELKTGEKVLLLILAILLVVLVYRQFVEIPVKEAIAEAESRSEALQIELDAVNGKLATLRKMQAELDEIKTGASGGLMPSYNNAQAELDLLNEVLQDALSYTVSFPNVTRNGDQVRRSFTLQFAAPSYHSVESLLSRLSLSPYRCLLGDVSMSNNANGTFSVNVTATFYETMVGGTEDAGLPPSAA